MNSFLKPSAGKVDLTIFSSAHSIDASRIRVVARQLAYLGTCGMRSLGVRDEILKKLPFVRKAMKWDELPILPVDRQLQKIARPPVFGLEMYNTIASSKITLNIHADSSPSFVSNMRLFEATGVGSCQLVDWRPNLPKLFTPDSEVVAYRHIDECLEKIRWLRDHPIEREQIARAGQKRCLSEHTFQHRASELDQIIRRSLA